MTEDFPTLERPANVTCGLPSRMNVAGFTAGVQMEIRQVPGMKNKLLGGEGLFNTVLTGPGRIWLQTMPISGVAAALLPYIPTGNN